MQQITFEAENKKDLNLLLQIARRLNIKHVNRIRIEIDDALLTKIGKKLSESSLYEGWKNEDDAYWQSFLKKK